MGHGVVNDDVVVSNGSLPRVPVSACGCLLEGFSGTWGRSQGPKSPLSVGFIVIRDARQETSANLERKKVDVGREIHSTRPPKSITHTT